MTPSTLHVSKTKRITLTPEFSGDVKDYDFARQTTNYLALVELLKRYNVTLDKILATTVDCVDFRGVKTGFKRSVFIVTSKETYNGYPKVVWYKYNNGKERSGQNWIYICGEKDVLPQVLHLHRIYLDRRFNK